MMMMMNMLLTNNTIESKVSSRFAETRFAEIRVRVRVRVSVLANRDWTTIT